MCSSDLARIGVSGPTKYTGSTAKAEIAPPREPEKSIFSETLLNASGGATLCIADNSANPDPFLARIGVSGPPGHPSSPARAKISPPRRPKRPILNLGLLCCWRGAFISVDILA